MSLLLNFLSECISVFPFFVVYCTFISSGLHVLLLPTCYYSLLLVRLPDWDFNFAVHALVTYSCFFSFDPLNGTRSAYIRISTRILVKVVRCRQQTHCWDNCAGSLGTIEMHPLLVRSCVGKTWASKVLRCSNQTFIT
ncbi:hypothetical protein BDA99DRAFT_534069 [Phascolomyces articulosus]|uniref:Uncharacterized protein n=1 Tax=Phascolomyces articulosus TaxID=60185 RepID=A0AAD5KGL7_9FUNG|nr:hypothetical protein BDA99DRAFT_534069 [Phascolomyces articulosus]